MSNESEKKATLRTNDALIIAGFVAIIVITVDFVGYVIGQRLGATNVPIATFFVGAIVLFAFCFPLLRTYIEKKTLEKLTEEDFAKQVSKINLADDSPLAALGTYRFTLAVVVALILAAGMFILVTASNLDADVTKLIQTILTVLTGGFTSIVAFYYGTRAAQDGAADAKATQQPQPLTAGETLLATLETLCGLHRVADRESIIKGLAEEYRKLTATDKVAVQDGLLKSKKCANRKELTELFTKAIDVPASNREKPARECAECNGEEHYREIGSNCRTCIHIAKFICKILRKHV